MRSFAENLYYGRFVPCERGRSENPEFTPLNRKICDIKKQLQNNLPPEEWKRFEELEGLYTQMSSIEENDAFYYGLNMGILFMIGAFDFMDRRITE